MWRDVIESVHSKGAETNFRLVFLACETLQFSLVMTNIHTKRTHSSTMSKPGGGRLSSSHVFSTSFNNIKAVGKIMQSAYLCVVLQIGPPKNQFLRFLSEILLIVG